MNDEFGQPMLRSLMGNRIWRLMSSDPDEFKRETRAYFSRGYPGWTVMKVKYPIVFLRDDRGHKT
ncbi:hypothetical protein PAEVO_28700 [Paenibacillus sp. GM2FR]|uniref:hypothetical protein n=1 Tax=Paenibacillus sp. GM2FR TaxID=2059268 RepID=UPI000C27C595|nr:hypothetical protein [Paenibacillus sp. GM2FR]PJN56147.1 hypothetical protein PAEVO_28700 [Paenibacillus sp. GM2FR]